MESRIFKLILIAGLFSLVLGEIQVNTQFVGSLKGRTFATGFLVEGRVVAPLHFARANCDHGICYATFSSAAATCQKLTIWRELATVDLAVLKCAEKLNLKGFRVKKDFNQNLKKGRVYIAVADNKGAGSVELRQGRIKSITRMMQIISTRVTFGASGAPVFDQGGKLVGVVTRSENFFDALLGRLLPFYRFSAKAVNIKYVRHILTKEKRMRDILKNDLLDHYRRQVRHQSKLKRFFESIEFTSLINKYAYDLRLDPEVQRVMLLKENEFWQKESISDSKLFPLLVAYHLEKFGMFGVTNPSSDSAEELVKVFQSLPFKGQAGFFAGLALLVTVWFSFLIFTLLTVIYGKLRL